MAEQRDAVGARAVRRAPTGFIVDSADLWQLVARRSRLRKICSGFKFVEGPVWNDRTQVLAFSDIIADTIYEWSPRSGIAVYRHPSHMANGLAIDEKYRLVACEHSTSRVTRTDREGNYVVLASHFEGRELNSPNDVALHSSGWVYFTDPVTGRGSEYGVERQPQLTFRGCFRVSANGDRLQLIADDYELPNGLCFSPGESRLYVNDSRRLTIRCYRCTTDGSTTTEGTCFFVVKSSERRLDAGCPDGMKVDEQGNVYCTGPGGVWVINEMGERLGVIRTPVPAANLTWGGHNGCTLFITALDSVYAIGTSVSGGSYIQARMAAAQRET